MRASMHVHNSDSGDTGTLVSVLETEQEADELSVTVMRTNSVHVDVDLDLQEDINTLVAETEQLLAAENVGIAFTHRR